MIPVSGTDSDSPLLTGSASAAGLIASTNICPDRSANGGARSLAAARRSMTCMINFARRRQRLHRYRTTGSLNWSARKKSADILRCRTFSHTACGRGVDFWIRRSGYVNPRRGWSVGENIAWGSGGLGNVRSIFNAWMHSTGHRRAILDRRFTHLGVGVARGRMNGIGRSRVWTLHFGERG
ncbi:MAG: CAP domain-containing protein [Solirubrobacterales bacterium]|nr:CAP domain-containing protein [Solirubrobacterales bacterium]